MPNPWAVDLGARLWTDIRTFNNTIYIGMLSRSIERSYGWMSCLFYAEYILVREIIHIHRDVHLYISSVISPSMEN